MSEKPEKNAAEENAAPPAKKGPFPLPPIVTKIAILGGLLVVTAVGVLFLVTEVIAPKLKGAAVAEGGVEPGAEGAHGSTAGETKSDQKAAKKGGHGGEAEASGMVDLGDLVVNPAGTGGRRYLKVKVSLELSDPHLAGAIEARSPQLRDRIIRELTSRTLSELTDPVAKDEMKATMLDEINHILGEDAVGNLYFTEYVIQ
jgi:flagellar FliL protein